MAVMMTHDQYAYVPGVTPMGPPGIRAPPGLMAPQMAPAMMAPPGMRAPPFIIGMMAPQMAPAMMAPHMAPQMSPTVMAAPVMVTRPAAAARALPVGVYGEDAKKAILKNLPPGSYFAEDKGRDDGKYHGECTCTVM